MIELHELHFRYHNSSREVLDNVTLRLPTGRIVGLLGKNGTGKSTLIYLMAGLLRPQKGTVRFGSHHVADRTPEMLSDLFVVPEHIELPAIRLSRFVELHRAFYPNFSDEQLNENLQHFDLTPEVNLGALSTGQLKKAYISFALATGTRLLLMDEPTNGLDIPSKAQFRRAIAASMNEERTVIISTHQVHDVENLVDHIVMLKERQVGLNIDLDELGRLLRFEQRAYGEDLSDVLYAENSLAGMAVIVPNREETASQVNLELLFNALTQHPDLLERAAQLQPSAALPHHD
ncbi:MAG: ATP-binding cassette domain-containing protein [Prevotellaceae bacterium]|nr:ATP-binding cassette domain-containing protein [Prevotellaceae bacterium]